MGTAIPEYEEKFYINHVGKDRTKLIIANNEEFAYKLNEYKQLTSANPE
jgi:hypothetical protein